ncbi:fucose 4-O-acetylase-like acetyltransferase [Nocardioides cavernae]|uniref:Fucose 4-O-acetylase-like acetyltransferase n=1 Tax=Nocardioides cavernae TaxID=1921566 RepID=A0A7Y9KQP8_9ACTN|nr:acyltransferase [Nocardioides cavernae]NYE35774.1 fucose 4-O-acetylase-like acetyltransferase [Nocardioides cavernae]
MEASPGTSARDRSVDVARGIAIVAIVLGHVERGLASSSLLPYDTALTLDRLLYLFHLATFAYLSGLFVRRAVERDGPRAMLSRRITLFVWLYLLWTVVQGTVRVAASSVANTPVTVADVARIWVPEGQLWFLPWLIGVSVVAALTQPWRSRARGAVLLALAAVLALAVWGYDPLYAFTRGWALLLPFLIGCVVTQSGHAVAARRTTVVAVAAVVGTAVWLWVGLGTTATTPTTGGDERTVPTVALGVLGCLAGTVAALAVAALVARTPVAGVVALLGRRSLEIFLAHIVVASGTRILLDRAGVGDPWMHLVAGTTLGVAVPLLVAVVADRLRWTWVFGLPRALDPSRR